MTRPQRLALTDPHIVVMPSERMAVVETVGNPKQVGKQAIQALYGSVYTLKFAEKKLGRDFKVKPQSGRDPSSRPVCRRATDDRAPAGLHPEQGYKVDGPHEEEYLSRPDARVPKTLIRYRIRRSTQK